MKSKHHPTIQKELDWYNSNDKEAVDFRKSYSLDTSGDYYKYVPKKFYFGGLIKKKQSGGTLPTYDNSKYYPSQNIINQINKWEGDSMRTNNPISTEFNTFINQFPKDTLNKLKPNQLDALFSYNYNRPKAFRTKTLPYIQQLGTVQDYDTYNNIINQIADSFAVKSKLRGLIKRSNTERQIFTTKKAVQ